MNRQDPCRDSAGRWICAIPEHKSFIREHKPISLSAHMAKKTIYSLRDRINKRNDFNKFSSLLVTAKREEARAKRIAKKAKNAEEKRVSVSSRTRSKIENPQGSETSVAAIEEQQQEQQSTASPASTAAGIEARFGSPRGFTPNSAQRAAIYDGRYIRGTPPARSHLRPFINSAPPGLGRGSPVQDHAYVTPVNRGNPSDIYSPIPYNLRSRNPPG